MIAAVTLSEVDGRDPAVIDRLLPLYQTVTVHNQRFQPVPDAEVLRGLIEPRATSDRRVISAFDDSGEAVAYTLVTRNLLTNSERCQLELRVAPERYGQGIGTALLHAARDLAREMQCDQLVGDFPVAADGVSEFAEKHGGKPVYRHQRTVLQLGLIDVDRYRTLATPAQPDGRRPGNTEYRSVCWTDHTPDHLVQAHLVARDAISDEPTGGLTKERKTMTLAELRRLEDARIAYGQRRHTVAVLAPDGEMAAFTQVAVFVNSAAPLAPMGNTAVVRAHRGRGLALRIKAELGLMMREREPHIELIDCWNNTENTAMTHVNQLLGWEVVATSGAYAFDL